MRVTRILLGTLVAGLVCGALPWPIQRGLAEDQAPEKKADGGKQPLPLRGGDIHLFPFHFAPRGFLPCDGNLLYVAAYHHVFSIIANSFGGDGVKTFATPKPDPVMAASADGYTDVKAYRQLALLQGKQIEALGESAHQAIARLQQAALLLQDAQKNLPRAQQFDPTLMKSIADLSARAVDLTGKAADADKSLSVVNDANEAFKLTDSLRATAGQIQDACLAACQFAKPMQTVAGNLAAPGAAPDPKAAAVRKMLDDAVAAAQSANGSATQIADALDRKVPLYTTALNAALAVHGSPGFAPQMLGEVRLFAFGFSPSGCMRCDGRLLPVQGNPALFSLLGDRFGGNGRTNFALPKLASPSKDLNHSDFLQYHISLRGFFPQRNEEAGDDGSQGVDDVAILGEVRLMALPAAPAGWQECNGQLLKATENQALNSLLAGTYGGEKPTTFALPKLPSVKAARGELHYYICVTGIYPGRD